MTLQLENMRIGGKLRAAWAPMRPGSVESEKRRSQWGSDGASPDNESDIEV
jgi:hypothetical protein